MTLTAALEPTGSPEPTSPLHVPALTTGCWLDGAPVDAAGRSLPLVDPTTGQPAGEVRCASPEQVEAALAGARAARRGWRTTAPGERAAALRAAAASVRDHADVLGDLLVATTGRLVGQARGSAAVAAELLEEAATTGVLDAGRSLAGSSGAIDVVRREPRGTVAVITPWNDPFPAAAGLLAAALVAGNTVVHKPSDRSSGPGAAMAALIAAALPPGVLQVVTGDGEVGEALVADDRVDVVAQVGSTATGRRIGAVAGARGAVALLENGGKDPLLVDAGVDPAWAAAQVAAGAFTNSGQLCTSVERVYLHADVADAVLAELVELARGLVVADPADPDSQLGPLVDERQLAVVSAHVEAALAAGAQALAGGERLDRPGAWYPADRAGRVHRRHGRHDRGDLRARRRGARGGLLGGGPAPGRLRRLRPGRHGADARHRPRAAGRGRAGGRHGQGQRRLGRGSRWVRRPAPLLRARPGLRTGPAGRAHGAEGGAPGAGASGASLTGVPVAPAVSSVTPSSSSRRRLTSTPPA
ncbi:MAG: aldehyde dehydrogenase family protein [Quadrisphaera sp.]